MTARERLQRTQVELVVAVVVTALLWDACAGVALFATHALADAVFPLPLGARALVPWEIGIAAIAIVVWRVVRAGPLRDERAVALWIERLAPSLRYALVTRIDPAGEPLAEELERAVAAVAFEAPARQAAWRPLLHPTLALVAALALLAVLPAGAVARVTRPVPGDSVRRSGSPGNALAHVAVTVTSPRYTGLVAVTSDDPSRVGAVVGSAVHLEGAATGGPVTATADSARVAVREAGIRWQADMAMPALPTVVRLHQGARERLLLLEPRPDSAPAVALTAPARDTVLRIAAGALRLGAELADDFGLESGHFEVVISSGEGESVRFRTLTIGRAVLANARTHTLVGVLRLDSLKLEPGDLLHVRAVARDRNTVTGPGVGASETRAIRIARSGEYDSVDVEGAPPADPLKGLISQRMLVILAERLEKQRPSLARATFVDESRRIARDQNTLRKQVGDVVFSRLDNGPPGDHGDDEHQRGNLTPEQLLAAANEATRRAGSEPLDFAGGESPVVNINRPLLEAYNAMWDAGRELGVGEPKQALPFMYAALAAIQRARNAERIYLRGRPKDVVVDIARVRLAGKQELIGPGPRRARASEDDATLRRLARFDRALGLLAGSRAAGTDSLLLLRAELLSAQPAMAAPLAGALDKLRSGVDATSALMDARRSLAGALGGSAPLGRWGRAP